MPSKYDGLRGKTNSNSPIENKQPKSKFDSVRQLISSPTENEPKQIVSQNKVNAKKPIDNQFKLNNRAISGRPLNQQTGPTMLDATVNTIDKGINAAANTPVGKAIDKAGNAVHNELSKVANTSIGKALLRKPDFVNVGQKLNMNGAALAKGVSDSATLGLTSLNDDQQTKDFNSKHPTAYNVGSLLGYSAPFGITGKAFNIKNPTAIKNIAKSAIEGASIGGIENSVKGESATKGALNVGMLGAVGGSVGEGISKIANLKARPIEDQRVPTKSVENKIESPNAETKTSNKKPIIINGKLKVKAEEPKIQSNPLTDMFNDGTISKQKVINHLNSKGGNILSTSDKEIVDVLYPEVISKHNLTNPSKSIKTFEQPTIDNSLKTKGEELFNTKANKKDVLIQSPLVKNDFSGSKPKIKETPSVTVNPTESPIKLKLETTNITKSLDDLTKTDLNRVKKQLTTKLNSNQYLEGNKQALQRDLDKVNSVSKEMYGESQPKIPNNNKTSPINPTDDILGNSNNWKNKSKFSFKNNTMERNFYDIMPKEEAKKMTETYIDPIRQNEANSIRELNQMRDSVKKIGIKAGSKESELAQKYGEGVISLDELKQSTPNWQKVKDTANYMRNTYDSLIDRANETLQRNGYDPIPKRKNYMPHQGEMDSIMKTLGIDNPELPTDINGLTGMFTPGKNWFGNALRRKGDQTVYDAVRGFDDYINGVNKIIHHTDDIQRIRELENTLRTKHEGTDHLTNFVSELHDYGNLLAGKKSEADRGFENIFGRKVYKVYDGVRKQLGANMIGGNVSSALTNFIPLNQALATTDKASFVQGMMDTIKNTFKNDGFIDKSDYLTRRIGSDKLAMSNWEKIGHSANWMFKNIDNFVGQSIVRGKYNELIKKGLPEETALKQANDYAGSIMADRSLGMTPTLYQSKVLSPITQFQLEVNNQLHWLTKDLPRNSKNKAALSAAIGQLLVYNYVFNTLFEKATGRRPAFDPIGVALQAHEDYNNPKLKTTDANKNLLENVANQLPYVSAVTGGRIPISSAIPDVYGIATGTTNAKKEVSKLPLLLLPTGGGQIKKTVEGLDTFNKGGSYNNGKLKFPVEKTNGNLARSALFGQYSSPEAKKYFDNAETPLSEKQTKIFNNLVNKGNSPDKVYDNIINRRDISGLQTKLKALGKNRELTPDEKKKEADKLRQALLKLKK